MSDGDYARKLDELERLLNDPDVPMEPGLVWSLLDEISQSGDFGRRDILSGASGPQAPARATDRGGAASP